MSGFYFCYKCRETVYFQEYSEREHNFMCKNLWCADECSEICEEYPPHPFKHEGRHMYENEEKTIGLEWD